MQSPIDSMHKPITEQNWILRAVYLTAGFLALVLAVTALILPLLPATPFFIAASVCFLRSSQRLHNWLRTLPWIGQILRDWDESQGVRGHVKAAAVVLAMVLVGSGLWFSGGNLWVEAACVVVAGLSIWFVVRLPTVRPAGGESPKG
jgi:hypothetical protein